jgi:hypothetical protein
VAEYGRIFYQALWTYWHQCLGDLSKTCMRSQIGMLPKQLVTCVVPLCPSYIAGKSSRKPWSFIGGGTKPAKRVTSLGQLIHVDQLESPRPGFIGQMKSQRLTVHCNCITTVFVDTFSNFSFIWHQTMTTAEQTLVSKHVRQAFLRFQQRLNLTMGGLQNPSLLMMSISMDQPLLQRSWCTSSNWYN